LTNPITQPKLGRKILRSPGLVVSVGKGSAAFLQTSCDAN